MVLFTTSVKKKHLVFSGVIIALLLGFAPGALASKSCCSKQLNSDKAETRKTCASRKCDCCFNDEISFGSIDMFKIVEGTPTCCPDFLSRFSDLIAPALSWRFTFPNDDIGMQFEVPRDLSTKFNVQVEIHFIATNTTATPVPAGTPFGVSLTGLFAGPCTVQQKCWQQCFQIPCNLDPVGPGNYGAHFSVTFCLDPKDTELLINPGYFGTFFINTATSFENPSSCENNFPLNPAIGIVAVSFRYRKVECKGNPICSNTNANEQCFLI